MAGILIGKLQVTNGTGDGRFQLESGDLAGSGQDLSRVGGFLIFVNERVMFASQWDEKEILRETFVTREEWEAEEKKQKEQRAEEDKKAQEQKRADEARSRQNNRQPGQGRRQQFSPVQNPRARQIPVTLPLQSDGQQSMLPPQSAGQQSTPPQSTGQQSAPLSQPAALQSRHQVQTAQSKPVEVSHTGSYEQPAAEPSSAASQEQPAKETLRAAGQELPADENLQAAEAAAQLRQAPQQAEEPWTVKWQFILENYPVLTPFEGEEEILCVRLELKDLRLLPKRYWYLGNNSFLLHGFFNYRYLILGAMEQEGSKRWFIGIPGIFQSQEKVMASIFGFTEYKSEKTAEQKTDEFGYWYRFLE